MAWPPKSNKDIIMVPMQTPPYSPGILLGNWVEDSIECPKNKDLQFTSKQDEVLTKLERETRAADFRMNKLHGAQGDLWIVLQHDGFAVCDNYTTTNDLVYNHLSKPLCGPVYRTYRPMEHMFVPQPDLMKCFGNVTEWGLRKYKLHEWACTGDSEYMSSSYNETFTAPRPDQLLPRHQRFGRDASFSKSIKYKFTKSK